MPDYQKGKIYQIWDEDYQECYIGSTVQELSMRMCGHRKDYRRFKEGNGANMTVYKIFAVGRKIPVTAQNEYEHWARLMTFALCQGW